MRSRSVARSGFLEGMNPTVTLWSLGLIAAIVIAAVVWREPFAGGLEAVRGATAAFMAWYYVALVAFFLGFIVWLGMGRYKNVRLGYEHESPEFRTLPWLAMLFAAGTGVGLLFWSIAEPIEHFIANPFVEQGETPHAAAVALRLTFFHWGLSGWAIFAVVGLVLAYFGYRREQPLTLRSSLHALLDERAHGPLGHTVDVFAVLATVFGVATTLGLGAQQIDTGMHALLGTGIGLGHQLVIILVVSAIATVSAISGVRRGVRRLSELNLWLAGLLLAFFAVFGPTWYLFAALVQGIGDYLHQLVALSFYTEAYRQGEWQAEWTVFYWGWWIAWSPFVGMFIARISRGRTIREFVMGVMLVPSLFSFVWIAFLGGTALEIELSGPGGIAEAVERDVTLALYQTIDAMGVSAAAATAASAVATALIAIFFVTSADSGTLVVNTILSDGASESPKRHRALWGLGIGALTAVVLVAGGLEALQSSVIMAALPFSVVMVLMIAGLMAALRQERFAPRTGHKARLPRQPWAGAGTDEPD